MGFGRGSLLQLWLSQTAWVRTLKWGPAHAVGACLAAGAADEAVLLAEGLDGGLNLELNDRTLKCIVEEPADVAGELTGREFGSAKESC